MQERPKELPRALSEITLADRERTLEQLFRVILEFAQKSKISAAGALKAFQHARHTVAQSPYRLSDAHDFQVMVNIAQLLTAWYTDPDYLDAKGAPAPLPLVGRNSLKALMTHFVPELELEPLKTAEWLIREGVLRRSGPNLLIPVRRNMSYLRPNAMIYDRLPFLVQGLLSTVNHNLEAKRKGRNTRSEQMLALDQFPVSAIPHFDREVKRLVPLLLNQLESWASAYMESGRGRQKTARVGVEVFSYVEARGSPGKRGRNS